MLCVIFCRYAFSQLLKAGESRADLAYSGIYFHVSFFGGPMIISGRSSLFAMRHPDVVLSQLTGLSCWNEAMRSVGQSFLWGSPLLWWACHATAIQFRNNCLEKYLEVAIVFGSCGGCSAHCCSFCSGANLLRFVSVPVKTPKSGRNPVSRR